MELENNAYFWQKLDTLVLSSTMVIDHKKNTSHPNYPNLIYPDASGKSGEAEKMT